MDRNRVAAHYRGKGYTVHENLRAAGASGKEYLLDMLAEGPLGNLLISFGDAAGLDGPEMGSARRIAKDIGATPVLAGDQFAEGYRMTATRLGVVILDAESLEDQGRSGPRAEWPPGIATVTPGDTLRSDLSAHPWPSSGRSSAAGPEGPKRARDVDELLADLQEPVASDRREASSGLWRGPGGSASAPGSEQVRHSSAAGTPVAGEKFAWLKAAGYRPDQSAGSEDAGATVTVVGQGVEPEASVPEVGADIMQEVRRKRLVRRAIKFGIAALAGYLLVRWWV